MRKGEIAILIVCIRMQYVILEQTRADTQYVLLKCDKRMKNKAAYVRIKTKRTHSSSFVFSSFRKKRSILMLCKEVAFFDKPNVLVVRDLQKECD